MTSPTNSDSPSISYFGDLSPEASKEIFEAYSSLRISAFLGTPSTKEQRQQAFTLFEKFKEMQESQLLYDAISRYNSPQKKESPSEYLNLCDSKNDKRLQENADKQARVFVSLQNFSNVLLADNFLHVPARKTHEVAQAFLNGYNPICEREATLLGKGSFGTVEKIPVLNTPTAAKSIHSYSPDLQKKLLKEAKILQECSHENVIGLDHVDQENGKLYLELASQGTMKNFTENKLLTSEILYGILKDIIQGCAHIHSKGFIHKDLKLDNVLIFSDNNAKISDFGSAEAIDEFEPTKAIGTILYSSPEALTGKASKEHCTKLDVWSFGMIIWELLKKDEFSTPFVFEEPNKGKIEPKDYKDNIFMFIYLVGKKFTGFSKETLEGTLDNDKRANLDPTGKLFNIMQKCLSLNPETRPSMEDLIKALT